MSESKYVEIVKIDGTIAFVGLFSFIGIAWGYIELFKTDLLIFGVLIISNIVYATAISWSKVFKVKIDDDKEIIEIIVKHKIN